MKPEWQHFLIDAGAELQDLRVTSFGNPERERSIVTTGNVLCDLSHLGVIRVHGEDACGFLHSQLTSDVRELSDTRSQLSGYCSPKGRMLACFRVFRRGDTFYLRLPRELLEATLERLSMFVLRAKVTLEDATDEFVKFGLSGPETKAELEQVLGAYPLYVDDCEQMEGISVLRIPGLHPRFEIYGELAAMKQVWNGLNVRGAPVGASPWALLDILAGIPTILPATRDQFVPQMVNLHLLGGVSFNKGCYPGQEVVARMQYLGTLKRRMYRALLSADSAPQPGDQVFPADGDGPEPSGVIVDAQSHAGGRIQALAVLRIYDAEHRQLRLSNPDGVPLQLASLPYKFELRP